jgi:hypothetical protein
VAIVDYNVTQARLLAATGQIDADRLRPLLELDIPRGPRRTFSGFARAAGFPLPSPGSRVVTQEDFPRVIEEIRAASAATFGAEADAP